MSDITRHFLMYQARSIVSVLNCSSRSIGGSTIKKYRRFNSSINQIRFQPIVRVIWSQDGQINPPPLCNIEDRVLRLPTPTAITFVLGNFEILFQKSMPCGKGRECILHLGVRMAVYKLSVCKLSQVMLYRVTQVEIKFLQ